ncbi:MAG TPA: type I phosphomannose isomerase catalytic subunit [Candidatus Methylacidiphilales bacterium]|nr:type I phosphomannose isomerase catalytic subunit [Candidatus Methylacidiphilales bacterium]
MNAYFFKPILQERIWGGRNLAALCNRTLPEDKKIGESWELSDRPEAVSDIISGPGVKPDTHQNLHTLWQESRIAVFGTKSPDLPRFPILIKLLDSQENLSVQVHPQPGQEGEPKTELWYFLQTAPEAKIYVGLKRGVTRDKFEKAIGTPELPQLLHTLYPAQSDAMFLPSGRIHAVGGGNVILEIQQNSDTTYRIDDWGRVDSQGHPRALHREQALASIRFNDFEPQFVQPHSERVLQCPYFSVERAYIYPGEYRVWTSDQTSFQYHFLAQGEIKIDDRTYKQGEGWLVPANTESYSLEPLGEGAELITVQWGG